MATQGPLQPGTAANDTSVGTIAWSTVDNAKASDNAYATALLATINVQSNYLKLTNFGFTITGTPLGALVEVELSKSGGGTASDVAVRIVKGGTIGATDRSSGVSWPTTDTYRSYGGSSDLWGESWLVGDVNASDFGFVISAKNTSASPVTLQVDDVRITWTYTPADIAFMASGLSLLAGLTVLSQTISLRYGVYPRRRCARKAAW